MPVIDFPSREWGREEDDDFPSTVLYSKQLQLQVMAIHFSLYLQANRKTNKFEEIPRITEEWRLNFLKSFFHTDLSARKKYFVEHQK